MQDPRGEERSGGGVEELRSERVEESLGNMKRMKEEEEIKEGEGGNLRDEGG